MKFRVGCLSWEDSDEDGCDVTGYDPLVEQGTSLSNRDILKIPHYNLSSAAEAAEVYADYCFHHRDGHEDKWPLLFRVRTEDGTEVNFEVALDMDPVFTAHEK